MWSVSPTGTLICCSGPFWSGSLCLFDFCLPSLQCLISTLTQVGGGGLLFRFTGSVVLWGGRGAADRYLCVGSTPRVPATLGLPRSWVRAFPVYTAQAPSCSIWSGPCVAWGSSFRVLHKSTDSVGPAFCAFPSWAAQAARSLTGTVSPGVVRLLPSTVPASVSTRASQMRAACVYSWELASSCDPPSECCPSRISGSLWLETGSLFAVL